MNWQGLTGYERLRPFLERATHPQPEQRFIDAAAARQFLWELRADDGNAGAFADSPEPASP